ncbi:class I SAM-dependent methyltransferase [Olivibacter sp. SDN3]|uniref:class I SAM-dependent methyltransferase n=1 Tax=Olivibacter sp. SDN3 TaxID=2764720 RepID=UPI00165126B3|nr:class I SAM-dependent methyltransferase [Olivibacter sp. SDN3]QNL48619.1 class I SAM-dependent methyltransferase [Olivibacter sp. SDN3]
MAKNNYDKIAFCYDFLSRLIFFRSQMNAQIELLPYIPKNSSVLIVGGGTGWILEEISKLHPAGLHIIYVELSANMLKRAQTRNFRQNRVDFIHRDIALDAPGEEYDVILTPFLFDNLTEEKALVVFMKLNIRLKPEGIWINTDFYLDPLERAPLKRAFLGIMYMFFRRIGAIEASNLMDINLYFDSCFYNRLTTLKKYNDFIHGTVYKKYTSSVEI